MNIFLRRNVFLWRILDFNRVKNKEDNCIGSCNSEKKNETALESTGNQFPFHHYADLGAHYH